MDNQSSELNEIQSLIKETQKNIKDLSVSQKETDRQMKATFIDLSAGQKERHASQTEMSKEIKKAQNLFTTQWGRLMESLVEGDLVRLLKEKGVKIERIILTSKLKPDQYNRRVMNCLIYKLAAPALRSEATVFFVFFPN